MNRKSSILEVLMSFFNQISKLENNIIKVINSNELFFALQQAGLDDPSILENTLLWLEKFTEFTHFKRFVYKETTLRTFNTMEKLVIPHHALNLLNKLYIKKEIDAYELEFIINQIFLLTSEPISMEEFIWILNMMMVNKPFICLKNDYLNMQQSIIH